MKRSAKRLAILAGILIAIAVGLFAALKVFFPFDSGVPSEIVAFNPTTFEASADAEFFYSIGHELKRSTQIDPAAPTLMRGRITSFLVAPDNKKIAVVADGRLLIVGSRSILRQIGPADSIYADLIYRRPKPIGKQFFRDDNFQWSRDSRVLYLIHDEFYASKGSQLFSSKGQLWKCDIETGALEPVIKTFPSFSYFLGIKGGIYFSTPTPSGDLQLRYFDGNGVTTLEQSTGDVSRDKLAKGFQEVPFFSFSIQDYEQVLRAYRGVDLAVAGTDGPQKLTIADKTYLSLTQGKGMKGSYYCSEMLRSTFLPGDRYFLFNARYCGNYNGQLLIDTQSGQYERLPADTVAYFTLNTDTHPHYRITGAGILVQ